MMAARSSGSSLASLAVQLASQRLVVAGIAEHGGQVGANQGLVIQGEQIGAADLRTGRAG